MSHHSLHHVTVRSELIDGVAMNAAHPKTFEISSAAVREGLEEGAVVKIGLRPPAGPQWATCGGERFWVEVHQRIVTPRGVIRYRGWITNDLVCEHGWDRGDSILFGPQHVLDE